jgi:hypothetical protein
MKELFQCEVSTSVYEMGGVNSSTENHPTNSNTFTAVQKRHRSAGKNGQEKKNHF